MFTLNKVFAITIPSTINVNVSIDSSAIVAGLLKTISKLTGGATAQDCMGAYVDNNGNLVTEKVTRVYAFSNDDLTEFFVNLASELKEELCQECVLVELNGVACLV